MKLRYTDRSKDDIELAFAWYERQQRGLGFDFLNCVEASLQNIIADYPCFRGGLRYPPKDAEIHRLLSQLLWYLNWFRRSAGLLKPHKFLTVRGLQGAKFWISVHPLMLNSAGMSM